MALEIFLPVIVTFCFSDLEARVSVKLPSAGLASPSPCWETRPLGTVEIDHRSEGKLWLGRHQGVLITLQVCTVKPLGEVGPGDPDVEPLKHGVT